MTAAARFAPLVFALGLAGCYRCNIFDGCASFTSDRARGELSQPTKVVPIQPT